ncbi:MAG: TolC family protein [Cytophagales bacterium]|nr:TolC family protein [Cytophagales bacterium]
MRKVLLCLLLAVTVAASAQESKMLTLDDCINMALQNGLEIERARNNELIARSVKWQSVMQFLPSVNAGINWNISVGNQFDQNTLQVVNITTQRSSPSIQANWIIFQGLSTLNTRNQRQHEYEAAQEFTRNTKLTSEANIMTFYLNVILSKENIKISQQRVDLLTAQLDRAEKRESVGVGNLEEVYNFRSQLATEKLNLATLENVYQSNKLQLLQAMQLDPTAANYEVEPYDISEIDLTADPDPFNVILNDALNHNPAVRAAEASQRASVFQYRAAQGQLLPTISVFGQYGSGYSSNGAFNPDVTGEESFEPDATFIEQMGYNEFQFVGFNMSIPIFTRFSNRNSIQTAKLTMANAEVNNRQARMTATNTVQTVYLDLIAARNTYISASENLVALQQSFDFMEKRYQSGNSDFYAYLESLNNKNRAEVQLANAKYSIVLRKRILDLYRGQNQ